MSLLNRFATLLRPSAKGPGLSLEIRPDGIAWASGSLFGFAECTPAKRLSALQAIVSDNRLAGADTTMILPLDQYQVFQLERPEGVCNPPIFNRPVE